MLALTDIWIRFRVLAHDVHDYERIGGLAV